MDRRLGYPLIVILLAIALVAMLFLAGLDQPWAPEAGDTGTDLTGDAAARGNITATALSGSYVLGLQSAGDGVWAYRLGDARTSNVSLDARSEYAELLEPTSTDDQTPIYFAAEAYPDWTNGSSDDLGSVSDAAPGSSVDRLYYFDSTSAIDSWAAGSDGANELVVSLDTIDDRGTIPAENLFVDLDTGTYGVTDVGTSVPSAWKVLTADVDGASGVNHSLLFSPIVFTTAAPGTPAYYHAYTEDRVVALTTRDSIAVTDISVYSSVDNAFVLDTLAREALGFNGSGTFLLLPSDQHPITASVDTTGAIAIGNLSDPLGSPAPDPAIYTLDTSATGAAIGSDQWKTYGSSGDQLIAPPEAIDQSLVGFDTGSGSGQAFSFNGSLARPASDLEVTALVGGSSALATEGGSAADAAEDTSSGSSSPLVDNFLALAMTFVLAIGMAVFVFTRLERDQALDGKRAELAAYIQAHPGVSVADLRREFNLSSSSAAHHLDVLEKYQNVVSFKAGKSRRYFANFNGYKRLASSNYKAILSALHNPSSSDFVRYLDQVGPMNQRDLAAKMGVHPSTVHWHGARLSDCGLVAKQPQGKEVVYTLIDPPLARHALELVNS